MAKKRNPRSGPTLNEFLEEEGLLAEAEAVAIKRVLAYQIAQAMEEEAISKAEMARRMNTSRSSLDRLLDPEIPSATLATMNSAAVVLGKRLFLALVDESKMKKLERVVA